MTRESYRRYVLAVLTLVYTLNYLDQNLVSLLLQPIKDDLHLSDSQLGLMTGMAFAFFYATVGLPIARWADHGNRSTITAAAIALWGVTVMSCVFVTNFLQMVFARIAAAVGESGCMPPTYSLLGDYFPGAGERTRAMGIYWLASPLASLISFAGGGWLNQLYGWRITFFVMGVPALLVAVVVKLTVVDPRGASLVRQSRIGRLPSKTEVFGKLWNRRSTRHLIVALILVYSLGAGLSPWYAAFLMRSHGMGTRELGVWLGLIFGVSGIVGILLGSYVAGRWFRNDERGQCRLNAITMACVVPCFVLFLLLPDKRLTLLMLIPLSVAFSFFIGPTFALLQRLVTDDMRATALAVTMLLANLIGMGIGPQVVGVLSDLLMPHFGIDSLRYAMLTMALVAFWAAYHFWQVGRTVGEDLSAVYGTGGDATLITRPRHDTSVIGMESPGV